MGNDFVYYHIRITYGENEAVTERFTFFSHAKTHKEDFDTAVKSINALYKQNGHFKTRRAVIEHFGKFGFEQTIM